MGRGKGKNPRQAEKILIVLISANGAHVTIDEIQKTLGSTLPMYKLPSYFWDLKKMGAQVDRKKNGRNIVSIALINVDEMRVYAINRGLIEPPPVQLKPEDLMVSSN